jgi:signal transduction histidine kinase
MIWNWLRRHPLLVDVGIVALLVVVSVGAAVHQHRGAAGIALGIAETLPLLWRRQRPVEVVVAVTAVAVTTAALGPWPLPFPLGVALYTLAARPGGRGARSVGVASIAAMTTALAVTGYSQFGDLASRVVFLAAGWLLGDSIRSRRAYILEIEEKAERLERERELQGRRAAAEEQARIARELHDVVAHALSVIVVQAAAADDVFEVEPHRVREPIRAIEHAARSALGDLRRVLGILHGGAEYEPQPGLARLDALVEQVRATGLEIALEVEGAPRPLPAAVDLSAYRIVQEALTNTLKHAGAAHATVRVRYGSQLDLEIRDDGSGAANGNGNGGSGLIGMRERVTVLGGSVDTGPRPGGGYRVSARIPI